MSRKNLVTRASQNHYSALSVFSIFDRQSLMYTNGYKIDYCGEEMLWDASYELLDSLLLSEWKLTSSEQWSFAVDYIGRNRITNIGIVSKPKLGSGLLYDDHKLVAIITILDHHKWRIS